jgi:hypothetical protein
MAVPVHVFGVNYLPGFQLIHSVCLVEGHVNIYVSLKRPISLECGFVFDNQSEVNMSSAVLCNYSKLETWKECEQHGVGIRLAMV